MCLPLDCYDDDDNDDDDDDDGAGGAGDGGNGSDGGDDEDLKDDDDDDDDKEEEVDDNQRFPTQSPMSLPAVIELIRCWAMLLLLGDDDDDDSGGGSRGGGSGGPPREGSRRSSSSRYCRSRRQRCGHRRCSAHSDASESSEGQAFVGEKERAPPPRQTIAADGLSATTTAMASGAVLHPPHLPRPTDVPSPPLCPDATPHTRVATPPLVRYRLCLW